LRPHTCAANKKFLNPSQSCSISVINSFNNPGSLTLCFAAVTCSDFNKSTVALNDGVSDVNASPLNELKGEGEEEGECRLDSPETVGEAGGEFEELNES